MTRAKTTTSKAPSGSPAKPKAAASATRTASRSAKRRSPKAPEEDGELLEYERLEFLKAMDAYKRLTNQTFPSWTEVLEVIRSIGWLSPTRLSAIRGQDNPSLL